MSKKFLEEIRLPFGERKPEKTRNKLVFEPEAGKFLAMRAFLTNTPQVVMEIPVAPITDDREHMIVKTICDERISLPLEAFKDHPEIYDQIVAILPADQLMDVKVAWRCNTTQYWHAEVDAAAAGPLYAKLGYILRRRH